MKRQLLSILLFSAFFCSLSAQEEKPVTVVKPGVAEIKAEADRPNDVIILSPASISGEFDTPPMHPACEKEKDEKAIECLANEVKTKLRKDLKDPGLDLAEWGSSSVSFSFVVDRFGEIKSPRMESADPELRKQAMVIIYDLPNFIPATKDGEAVNSNVQVNYRYEELFQ